MALVAAVVGCGGTRAGQTPAPLDASGPSEAEPPAAFGEATSEAPAPPLPAPSEESYEGDASASEPAAAPPSTMRPSPSKRTSEGARDEVSRSRPGLGTVWGEDRESTVRRTAFNRADPVRPFALATLFYNDREGIEAMSSESARFDHGDSGFRLVDGVVSVRLLDEDGGALPSLEVASRDYVVGEHGQAYSIEVRNHSGSRIEVVTTVDGLDVVDGEEGSFSKRGYIVGPFDTVVIDGFRRSTDTVAAFRFGSVGDSYAGRKGKARNVGVIGVAFFHELGSERPWTSGEVNRRHTADPFPGRFAEPPR